MEIVIFGRSMCALLATIVLVEFNCADRSFSELWKPTFAIVSCFCLKASNLSKRATEKVPCIENNVPDASNYVNNIQHDIRIDAIFFSKSIN